MQELDPFFAKKHVCSKLEYAVYDTVDDLYVYELVGHYSKRFTENHIKKTKSTMKSFSTKNQADTIAYLCNSYYDQDRYVVHQLEVTVAGKECHTYLDEKVKKNIQKIITNYEEFFFGHYQDTLADIVGLFNKIEYKPYRYLMLVKVLFGNYSILKNDARTYLSCKNIKRLGVNKSEALYGFYVQNSADVINFKLVSTCNIEIQLFDLKSSEFQNLSK